VPISRLALGIAVALAALLIAGVIVIPKLIEPSDSARPSPSPSTPPFGPVALVPVEAPDAGSAACASLIDALPAELTSGATVLRRRPIAEPAPPATVAWGENPVVLRCGLTRPPELTPTAELRLISGVNWLPVQGDRATTWYLVDRAVYVALTVPDGTGTGVLQGISEVVGRMSP
jgi:Protein of unknown function (DUF3515)